MVKVKDLVNRDYVDGRCVAFETLIPVDENSDFEEIRALFKKDEMQGNPRVWQATLLIKYKYSEPEVIHVLYTLPVEQNIDMICATGLNVIRSKIVERIQNYSVLDFLVNSKTEGM